MVYERLEKVELYPFARDTLEKLKEDGYKLGLVSTSTSKMLSAALKNNSIEHLFDVIISADDTDKHKPDPTPLFIALEHLGSKAEDAIFVGDSDKDTGAASNAKIPLILFSPIQHNLYYDLNALKSEASVTDNFSTWKDFPFDKLGE